MKTQDGRLKVEKATEAAFISLEKVHLVPGVGESGRVYLEGDREQIMQALSRLQSNPKVPILDYITRLQTIKGIIFTLKNNARAERAITDKGRTLSSVREEAGT